MGIYSDYELKGITTTPLKGKRPFLVGWQEGKHDPAQLDRKFSKNNIGMLTGTFSGLVVLDIDIEDPDLKNKVLRILKDYPTPIARHGSKNRLPSRFYQYNDSVPSVNIENGGNKLIELLSDGRQCVLPPSKHPDGHNYEWVGESLLDFDVDMIPEFNLDMFEKLNLAVAEHYKTQPITIDSNRGRNNSLKNQAYAKIAEGKDLTTAITELIEFDKENHDPPLFTDKSEGAKVGNAFFEATRFYTNVMKTAFRNGDFESPITAQETQIVIGPEKIKKKYQKLPKLPGLGDEIFRDLYDKSPIRRSQFCFMNTMNLMSILIGNSVSLMGTYANLFQYGVAPSGQGKDFSFKRCKKILSELNKSKLIGSTSPTSESVVLSMLELNRERCFFVNEAESMLKKIHDARMNHGLRECLTDLYDYGGKMHEPKVIMDSNGQAKTKELGRVYSPFLNLLLMSTQSGLENNSGLDMFNTGFGSRFLFYFEDRYKRSTLLRDYNPEIPPELLESLNRTFADPMFMVVDQVDAPHTDKLEMTREADLEYERVFNEIEKEKDEEKDGKFYGILSRKLMFVTKFAMIHHVMENRSEYKYRSVKKESYSWAYKAVSAVINNMIMNLDDSVTENNYEKECAIIVKFLSRRMKEGKGTAISDIHNGCRKLQLKRRKEILNDLALQGRINKLEDGGYVLV